MNPTAISFLVGAILPLVVSVIMRPYWPDYVRVMVGLAVVLLGGAATAYETGGLNNKDVGTILFIVTTSAYTFYRNVWKPTVVKWLEEHTTPGGAQQAAQDATPQDSAPVPPSPASVQDAIVIAATDAAATASATGKVPVSAELLQDILRALLPGAEAQMKAGAKPPETATPPASPLSPP